MSFFKDIAKTTTKVLGHARDEIIGTLNPDRRHDEEHEKLADDIRRQINESHRYHSFADERADNFVKWHIDGHDYMWAVSEMLDSAKEAIFILDWWLTPELYLRRPPAKHPEWRIDRILKRKAEQGVKIHVIVYKEVTQTMSLGSKHTKNYLESLHENVACMRHPDHIGSKDSVQFWSHHEKVIVVDNHYACIGGLDLCFGRWDTHNHPLADAHPTDFSQTLFPGQDYNNARWKDFQDVHWFASNAGASVLETPRMPWHDVHMSLTGPVVLDIIQHFVERWNEIKQRKYRDSTRVAWLSLPHDVQVAPNEAVARHPNRETWHDKGHRYKQRFHRHLRGGEGEGEGEERGRRSEDDDQYPHPASGATCRVQAVRSVSDWSHGVLTERSILTAYIQLINEASHFIYIENQFFITATKEGEQVTNLIGKALVDRIVRANREGKKFQVIVAVPELPGFSGNVKDEASLKIIMAGQYRSINRGGSSIYEAIRKEGIEPLDYIRFYHLRAYDRINAPLNSYIKKAEELSGVTFDQAQVALARKWIGGDGEQKEVTLKIVEPATDAFGEAPKDPKDPKTTITIPIPQSDEEAVRIIEKFENAAKQIRGDEDVSDNVVQHMLQDRTVLGDEKWLGTEQEELDSYVSELLYIHSKLMIVDDRKVIMGSANINERSQKGDGDSEIALVVEDTDLVESRMNGERYMASRFATSLRRKLFREHLGLIPPQLPDREDDNPTSFMHPAPYPNDSEFGLPEDDLVADPISEETLHLWSSTARKNREIFTEIFRPIPTNLVRTWKAYDDYAPKVKTGHVIPGISLERVKERLSQVKGALVECPLDFLIDEKEFVEGPQWIGLDPTLPIYI